MGKTGSLSGMVQQSARGSIILLLGQVVSTVILAAGAILVARLLGSTDYGVLTIATIPISIASMFSDLGVNSALVRYIAQYRVDENADELRVIVKAGLFLNSLVNVLLSLTMFMLSRFLAADIFHNPELEVLIEIGSVSLFAQALLSTCQSIFVGFERMELHSVSTVVFSIIKSALAPGLVLLGYGAFGAALGGAISLGIALMLSILIVVVAFMRSGALGKGSGSDFNAYREMLGYGLPLFLSGLLGGGLSQFFNFLVAVYVEASMIGNYQAAANFSVVIGLLTMPIGTVLFPLFSKLDPRDNSALGLAFQSSVKYASLILVPATAGLMVLSEQVVRIIYGGSYEFAPFFLQLTVFNSLFVGLGGLSIGSLLNSQGKTRVNFVLNLIYLCFGLPLGLILIPRFGVMGLLVTAIVASKPGLFYALWWIRRNFGFSIDWASSAKIFLASGIAFLMVYLILASVNLRSSLEFILGGAVFFLVYSILVPLTGALEKGDISNLRNITKASGPLAPFFNLFLAVISRFMRKEPT